MFEKIKNVFKKVWEKICGAGRWVKRNFERVAIASSIVGVALAATIIPPTTIPEHLQLKTDDLNKIISQLELDGDVMRYAYFDDELALAETFEGLSEDLGKRTNSSQFFLKEVRPNGEKKWIGKFYNSKPFYKNKFDGKWYKVKLATTTKEMFEKQVSPPELITNLLFGRSAYAGAATTSPIYAETSDGYLQYNDVVWAIAHGSSTAEVVDTTTAGLSGLQASARTGYWIMRTWLFFDTSSIGSVKQIDSVQVSVVRGAALGAGGQNFVYTTTTVTTPLVVGDYQNWGNTALVTFAVDTQIRYTNYLSSDAFDEINTGGTTAFVLMEEEDFDDTTPVASWYRAFYSSESTGTGNDPYLIVGYTTQDKPTITTNAIVSTDCASTTLSGTIDLQDATTSSLFFEYGLTASYGSTSTIQYGNTTSTTWTEGISGLAGVTEYHYRGGATSSFDGGATVGYSYGSDTTFITYVITTSTDSAGDWNAGTHTTTTVSGDSLILDESGEGGAETTTTDSFESVLDNNTDLSSANWGNVGGDTHSWRGETADTPSGSTGATDGSDGTVYVYVETSSGFCNTAGNTAILEIDFFGAIAEGYIWFDYNAYGANIGTLAYQSYDGSWNTEWSITGQQHGSGVTWTTITKDLTVTTTNLRFLYTCAGGYWGDICLDNIRVATSSSAYEEEGNWVSLAWDLSDAEYASTSRMDWVTTTPSNTTTTFYTATSTSSSSAPSIWKEVDNNGDSIPSILEATQEDLSDLYLWVKIILETASALVTPSVDEYSLYLCEGSAEEAPPTEDARADIKFISDCEIITDVEFK